MHICGGGMGVNGLAWYGVTFESQAEAEKVMKFLEKGIEKTSKVDVEQTETVKEKGKKGGSGSN